MNKVISLKKIRLNKRTKTLKSKKRSNGISFPKNSGMFNVFVLIFSIISVCIGALLYIKNPVANLNNFFSEMINVFQNGVFINIFKRLFLLEFGFIALSVFLGTNLFGSISIMVVPILKTFLSGYLGALIYNEYKLNGALFFLIFLVPYLSSTCTTLIALSRECYCLSKSIFNAVIQRKTTKDSDLQLFLVKCFIIIITDMTFVLLNSLLLMSFGEKISLQ